MLKLRFLRKLRTVLFSESRDTYSSCPLLQECAWWGCTVGQQFTVRPYMDVPGVNLHIQHYETQYVSSQDCKETVGQNP